MTTRVRQVLPAGISFDGFAAALTGVVIYSMSMQRFFLENVPLLSRMAVGLALLMLAVVGSRHQLTRMYLSAPVVGLVVVMAVSLQLQPELYILADFAAYLLAVVYAIVAVSVFGPKAAIHGAAIAFALLVGRNALAAFGSPGVLAGTVPLIGSFYGPNTLAASVLILMPAVLVLRFSNRPFTFVLRVLGVTAGFAVILLTRASTELAAAVLLFVLWFAFWLNRRIPARIRWALWLSVAAIPIAISLTWPRLLSLRGKDSTLSGRTEIWAAYFEMIMERPIQGYGWAIQTTWDMPLGERIAQVIGPQIHNAHNDLINWWAHTGLFGVLLYVCAIAVVVVASLRLPPRQHQVALWSFTTAVVMAINGLAELTSFYPDGWIVFCLVSSAVAYASASGDSDGAARKALGLLGVTLRRERPTGQTE